MATIVTVYCFFVLKLSLAVCHQMPLNAEASVFLSSASEDQTLFFAFGCVLQRILTQFPERGENKFRVMLCDLAWVWIYLSC